jgi:hypothetical protein
MDAKVLFFYPGQKRKIKEKNNSLTIFVPYLIFVAEKRTGKPRP